MMVSNHSLRRAALLAVAVVLVAVPAFPQAPTNVGFYTDEFYATAGTPHQFHGYAEGSTEGQIFLWDFGDGTTATGKDPLHTFLAADDHRVSLTVTNNFGSGNETHDQAVQPASGGQLPAVTAFEWFPGIPVTGQQIQFRDKSVGRIVRWRWNFDATLGNTSLEGTDSYAQNPTHTFTTTGRKNVELWVSNLYGRRAIIIFVDVFSSGEALIANFEWSPFNVAANQPTVFRDLSNGATSWSWDFGDGTPAGTEPNPNHFYSTDGQKTVTLTVSGPGGTASTSKQFPCHPTSSQALTAKYTWMPANPKAGEPVQFSDLSLGLPDSWSWTLSDGTQSGVRNLTRTFAEPGNYAVTLLVTKGGTTAEILHTVHVDPAPVPLDAPTGVVATANGTTSVSVTWNAVAGAANYEVYRSSLNAAFAVVSTSPNTTFNDLAVTADRTYLYQIRAIGAAPASPLSAIDAATTVAFTNDPLSAGNVIRAAHITQLRTAVNAMRAAKGLSPTSFTNPTLTAGVSLIRAVHLTQLRSSLVAARSAIGLPALTFTDPTITAGSTVVKAVHIQQLRDAVR